MLVVECCHASAVMSILEMQSPTLDDESAPCYGVNVSRSPMVGLLLVFTVKIGQTHRAVVRRRRVQRIWSHKRDECFQNLRD
jgi:hypothetical protein